MSWMASKTIEFGAIDQTAEPLCAKIEPTEPAISIDFSNYAPLYEKIQKRNFAHATLWSSQRDRGASRRDWRAGVRRSRAHLAEYRALLKHAGFGLDKSRPIRPPMAL